MSDVIHRTDRINFELIQRFSVHTPAFPTGTWIVNPDLSSLGAVPKRHWKIVVDDVLEMTQPEKDAADQSILDEHNATIEALIQERVTLTFLTNIPNSVVINGLDIVVNINTVIIDDTTTIIPDNNMTLFANVLLIFNKTPQTLTILVREKTNQEYADLTSDEAVVFDFGEWSVPKNGTVLTPV